MGRSNLSVLRSGAGLADIVGFVCCAVGGYAALTTE